MKKSRNLVAVLIFLSLLISSVLIDVPLIKGEGIDSLGHYIRVMGRMVVFAFMAVLVIGFTLGHPRQDRSRLILPLIAFFSSVWWIVFDLSLNIGLGLSPFYIGETAFLDKIFNGMIWLQLIAKFFALILSLAWVRVIRKKLNF